MTAETEQPDIIDALAAFDPECIFRAISLTLAVQTDAMRGHQHVLSVAAAYYDWIDPFALSEESTFKLKLEKR